MKTLSVLVSSSRFAGCLVLTVACAALTACASSPDSYADADSWHPVRPQAVGMESITLAGPDWKDAGLDTPEHALETWYWIQKTHNFDQTTKMAYLVKNYYKDRPLPTRQATDQYQAPTRVNEGLEKNSPGYQATLEAYGEDLVKTQIRGLLAHPPHPLDHPQTNMHIAYETAYAPSAEEVKNTDRKQILDLTILDRKWVSPTDVELDVRERWPEGTNYGAAYSIKSLDFHLDGRDWKIIEEDDIEVK